MGSKAECRSLLRRGICIRRMANFFQTGEDLVLQITRSLWSLLSVFFHHALEQGDSAYRQMRKRRDRNRLIQVLTDNLARGSEERWLAGQHEIKRDAQGVYIGANINIPSRHLFRTCKVWRADKTT